jgi:hypothetical protein
MFYNWWWFLLPLRWEDIVIYATDTCGMTKLLPAAFFILPFFHILSCRYFVRFLLNRNTFILDAVNEKSLRSQTPSLLLSIS